MSYLQECLERFENLPNDLKEKVGSLEAFEKIEKIEDVYGIDLKFLTVLISIGEISLLDAPDYLKEKYDLCDEDAYEIRDDLFNNFFFSSISRKEFDSSVLSINELINIFKENLIYYLNDSKSTIDEIDNLNESIFTSLAINGSYQDNLSLALLNNQERLFLENINLEGRDVPATISNCLKDFIKRHGSEYFDDLILLQYLKESETSRKISDSNKYLLRKILKIYRNIAFFPDSMDSFDLDNWQIIPMDNFPAGIIPVKKENLPGKELAPTLEKEKNDNFGKSTKTNLEKQKKEIESLKYKSLELQELEGILQKYPINSLEHKAISQEIKYLRNNLSK